MIRLALVATALVLALPAKVVRLERLTAAGWIAMTKAKLRKIDSFTVRATFRVVKRGLRLRVVVPAASARPCYAPGASNIVRS